MHVQKQRLRKMMFIFSFLKVFIRLIRRSNKSDRLYASLKISICLHCKMCILVCSSFIITVVRLNTKRTAATCLLPLLFSPLILKTADSVCRSQLHQCCMCVQILESKDSCVQKCFRRLHVFKHGLDHRTYDPNPYDSKICNR